MQDGWVLISVEVPASLRDSSKAAAKILDTDVSKEVRKALRRFVKEAKFKLAIAEASDDVSSIS